MGASVSKLWQGEDANMADYGQTMSGGNKENRTGHRSEHVLGEASGEEDTKRKDRTAKDKTAKGKKNTDFQSARMTREEPRPQDKEKDGGRYLSKSVRVSNFTGDISKLLKHFGKYQSDVKQVTDDGWDDKIVQFESPQIAEKVIKEHRKASKKYFELTLIDDTPKKKEMSISDRKKRKEKQTTSNSPEERQQYSGDRMPDIKKSSKGDVLDTASQGLPTPYPPMLQGMEGEGRNSRNEQFPLGQNDYQKATKVGARKQMTDLSLSELDIELDAVKVEFIKKVHRKEFDQIFRRNNIDVKLQTESSSYRAIFRENATGKSNADRACDQFMALYNRISDELSRDNIINVRKDLPDCTIQNLCEALSNANNDERVLVKNCLNDDFQIVFYGSEPDVAIAKATFIGRSRQHKAPLTERNTGMPGSQTSDNTHFTGKVNNIRVSVYKGDLTREKVDVIVNAANSKLDHGGGLALAISQAGGSTIQMESNEFVKMYGKLPIGQVMHTGAGNMPCNHVIHTVGPIWNKYDNKETLKEHLRRAMTNVLHYASNELQATSIAIPAISAGIYGVPVDVCAEQLMLSTLDFARSPPHNNTLRHINFVNIEDQTNRTFVRVFSGRLSPHLTRSRATVASDDKNCPICLDKVKLPTTVRCCGKVFCNHCIGKALQSKPACPTCCYQYGVMTGNQPKGGTMTVSSSSKSLPGYHGCGSLAIHYYIPNGIQEDCHPNPGRYYQGIDRTAFLPDNPEGRQVLQLLRKAFDNRLVFTVGTSVTTGDRDVVVWNIHHKTSRSGGAASHGYPDPDYLSRVKDELAAKGIR